MIVLRKFIIFLMFSAFLGGCSTPLITIDVKHSSGGQGNGAGSCHPFAVLMGWCISAGGASLPIQGKVEPTPIPGFMVTTSDGKDLILPTPPFVVNPVNGIPTAGSDVIVTFSNREIRIAP